mgnify:CR=1 FL=1
MKRINFIIKIVISIFIIYFLINMIGFKKILSNIILIDPLFFILSALLIIIGLVIGALNVSFLLLPIKKISFAKVFYYNTLSWSLGLFVPGKIGELSLIPFLKREGVSVGHGTVISILDKLISLIVLSLLSIVGFFIFLESMTALKLIMILFLFIAAFLFLIISDTGRNFIKKVIPRRLAAKFQGFSSILFYYLKEQKSIMTLNLIITFIKWVVNALVLYILFLAYNQNIHFMYILLINSVLMIISLIPISISGLGVRESAAVAIYTSLNVEPLITISTHLIPLIISYAVATLMILFSFKRLHFHI